MKKTNISEGTTLLLWASFIGTIGGLLGLTYYFILKFSIHFLWVDLLKLDWLSLPLLPQFVPSILIVTTLGGIAVGVSLKYLGRPGEIAAVVDNIHMENGKIDPKQTPSMIICSLLSIVAGGSAGPEAPLVQMIGSFGSWLGLKLKLKGNLVRTLTFCGMATALGAFFGAPLGGAIFALEIPHNRSIEYYESLVPSIVAAICGFIVFKIVLGYSSPIFNLPLVTKTNLSFLPIALLLGLLGSGIAIVFTILFKNIENIFHPLNNSPILLGGLGGLAIGVLAQVSPKTLFWGEFQIDGLITDGSHFISTHGIESFLLVMVGLIIFKMLSIGMTLHSGFRGGFIFPLFFIGAACGLVVHFLFPMIPLTVAVITLMAAINVAVTKTPISTSIILISITGSSLLPVVVIASFTSFLITTRLKVIKTQRPRAL